MSIQVQLELEKLFKLRQKIDSKINKVRNSCLHEELIDKREYNPGGYDYVATTVYYKICKFCSKTVKIEEVQHPGRYS